MTHYVSNEPHTVLTLSNIYYSVAFSSVISVNVEKRLSWHAENNSATAEIQSHQTD